MAKVPRRLLEKDYVALKQCRHGHFIYNKFDSFIGRSLDLYGEWCEGEVELLSRLISAGSVVVDIGANIGSHTVPLAKRVAPGGQIIAFEPQRIIFQQLCANIAVNGLTNVVCRPQAVGSAPGVARIPVLDPRQEFNFGGIRLRNDERGESVPVVTLDDFQLSKCHLIKIDVEGMEPAVIAGAAKTIERCHPILFAENNTEEASAVTIAAVRALQGYHAWWHIGKYFSPRNFFENRSNVFESYQPEANMLCIHESAGLTISGLPEVLGEQDTWRHALARHPQVLSAHNEIKILRR